MDEIRDLLQVKIEKAKAALPVETVNAIAAVDWKEAIIGMRVKRGYTFEQLGDLELETELLLCGLLSPADYPRELANRMKISGADANELVNDMNDLVFKKIREELIKNAERKKIFKAKIVELKTGNELKTVDMQPLRAPTTQTLKNILDTNAAKENPVKKIEKPELIESPKPASTQGGGEVHPLLAQKFSGSFQIPTAKTEYSLNNISKTASEVKASLPQAGQIPNAPATPPPSVKPGLPASIAEKIKPISSGDAKTAKFHSATGDPYRLSPDE